MSTVLTPYIKWGDYKSKNYKNPDILEIEVITLEQFESELTTNIQVRQKIHGEWQVRILPLKSHESNNSSLLKQWNELVSKKRIIIGSKILIHTHMGLSKYGRNMRKSHIEV